MQLAERLKTCLKIEVLCAEIYRTLGGIFPEAGELFEKLAKSEERHADIISISIGFNRIHDLTDSFVPSSLQKITETKKNRRGYQGQHRKQTAIIRKIAIYAIKNGTIAGRELFA